MAQEYLVEGERYQFETELFDEYLVWIFSEIDWSVLWLKGHSQVQGYANKILDLDWRLLACIWHVCQPSTRADKWPRNLIEALDKSLPGQVTSFMYSRCQHS